MKKLFKNITCIMIAVMVVLSVVSCAGVSSQSTSQSTLKSTTRPRIPAGPSWDTEVPYVSFEEYCGRVTTVVKAKIVEIADYRENSVKFTFKVTEKLYGTVEDTIYVVHFKDKYSLSDGKGRNITYSEIDVTLNQNDEYLLALIRSDNVYNYISPKYGWMYGALINLDNLSESEMYNESLSYHISGIDINACTAEEITNYVCDMAKNNGAKEDVASKAETLEEIVNDAPYILQVKLNYIESEANTDIRHTEIWSCTVVDVLKGDVKGATEIEMLFFGDTVEAGQEYIVSAEKVGSFYDFITPNSMRPLSEKEQIKGYIN